MKTQMTRLFLQRFAAIASALLLLLLALPQSSRAQDIDQTVARISFISGSVSYSRGDDPDEWDSAIVNVPLTLGDKIYAPEDGRAELQLPGGNFVRVGHRTYFTALNLTYDTKQFYLGEGAAAFNIRRLGSDEIFEVDTPNVAVTLDGPGKYRVEVDADGNTRILVRRGKVVVAANGRQITVREGEVHVYGIDSPRYEMVALRSPDAFDRWVDERDTRFERGYVEVRQYANDDLVGIEDLRDYGRWEDIPEYGRAWTPVRVAVGWRPYTVGHWFWQDPWGWTWISEEPWGWAPSHYGRWTFYRSRWYWVPVAPRVRVRYAPAVVAFVRDRDDVGWFPLAPRDRFISWWGRRPEPRTSQNITYVNRNYITVVNQNTFISSRNVSNNIVRDSVIVRESKSVRVMDHPLPIPNRSSLRVRAEREDRKVQRPPETIVARPAVVRTAPVPPPPTFQEKLPEIQKTKGEPVAPDKAQTMGLANLKASNRRNPIRPAAVESGRGDFAPRTPNASAPTAQPLTAPRGKKLATGEAPVVTNVPQRPERSERPAAKTDQEVTTPSEPSKGSARLPEGQQQPDRGPQKRGNQKQEQQQLREEQKGRDVERQQLQEQERQKQETRIQQQKEPQARKNPQREEQKSPDVERQRLQEQEHQSRLPPQEPQKEQSKVRKGVQREEQKARDLERQQLQEQERQKQETRLQRQPQKEAPQAKTQQREEQGREQLERRQPQKQERDLQQTKSQARKAPPEARKESQRDRQKRQEEEKKAVETPEPDGS